MPQSLGVLLDIECPSGTHTDTHVEVHAHTLWHPQGPQHHRRFGWFCFYPVCFTISYSLLFIVTFSVFNPELFVVKLQKPLKQCADATIQHWCQYYGTTFRLASRADRPLWLLYCGETMLSDISGVQRLYCFSYHLTAFCYLSSHQKWVSYRLKSRVQTEGHLYILGTRLDPSC